MQNQNNNTEVSIESVVNIASLDNNNSGLHSGPSSSSSQSSPKKVNNGIVGIENINESNGEENENDATALFESFDDMNLRKDLLRGVFAYGYEKPSIIQQKAIVPFSKGGDIIAQAQSGTGKTATYTIGMLQQLDFSKRIIQGLVLVPTRELANQVQKVVQSIGDYLGVLCHACIGGTSVSRDVSILRSGVHVVIGTPGRLNDLIKRNVFKPSTIKVIVLDEADEMLSRGFLPVIREIFLKIPSKAQVGIFSATMPSQMHDIASNIVRNPIKICVKAEELTLAGIRQFYVNVEYEDNKYSTMCDLFNEISVSQAVIFANLRRKIDWLANEMAHDGWPVEATHADKPDRHEIMEKFRNGNLRVLISSDLLARGIDIQQVSIVINYDMPKDRETYLHRIGRSGRFGRRGIAINFITRNDYGFLRDLEKFYETHVEELPKNFKDFI